MAHNEWVRLTTEEEAKWWVYDVNKGEYPNRTERYRYIEENDPGSGLGGSEQYVEVWRSVPDLTDEPEEDGFYDDKDGDRWLRYEGFWFQSSLYDGITWDESWGQMYGPLTKIETRDA
jgi:hypothetical protein